MPAMSSIISIFPEFETIRKFAGITCLLISAGLAMRATWCLASLRRHHKFQLQSRSAIVCKEKSLSEVLTLRFSMPPQGAETDERNWHCLSYSKVLIASSQGMEKELSFVPYENMDS